MNKHDASKVIVENVNHPGSARSVDARMYAATRQAILKVLPASEPGLTIEQLEEQSTHHLPEALFPEGAKAGWWLKTVQLDLEAKRIIVRESSKPLRLHKIAT